jgi:hypothetical protein
MTTIEISELKPLINLKCDKKLEKNFIDSSDS